MGEKIEGVNLSLCIGVSEQGKLQHFSFGEDAMPVERWLTQRGLAWFSAPRWELVSEINIIGIDHCRKPYL